MSEQKTPHGSYPPRQSGAGEENSLTGEVQTPDAAERSTEENTAGQGLGQHTGVNHQDRPARGTASGAGTRK